MVGASAKQHDPRGETCDEAVEGSRVQVGGSHSRVECFLPVFKRLFSGASRLRRDFGREYQHLGGGGA